MIHRNKLTPEYFIRRALKATDLTELVNANLGLYNLYQRHAEYQFQQFMECLTGKRTKHELV